MASMWQPQSQEIYMSWVDALETEASDSLTSWETGFVESIRNRLLNRRDLTKAQADTLERIYTEKTS